MDAQTRKSIIRTVAAPRFSLVERQLRKLVLGKLAGFADGQLRVTDPWGSAMFGQQSDHLPTVHLQVVNPRAYRAVALGGTMGAAEAYARGWWSADDLTALVRLFIRNAAAADGLDGWLSRAAGTVHQMSHWFRANHRVQSRRNIAAHYDLGNDFFALFLDPTMTYSCAVFPSAASSLEEASRHKMDVICRKLDLSARDELLEIGTGWGSLAIHAARHYGCRVVTTTVSREQYAHACAAVASAGLDRQVTVLNTDYRDLPDALGRRFDKVVSVEMIEAVGHAFLDRYFAVCEALTRSGGAMLLQSIVIADAFYEQYRRSVDVIQRYIFPGGFLPSVTDLRGRIQRCTGFQVAHFDDITEHYPKTLRVWRRGFTANWSRLRSLGYPERLLRLWDYYFCYCEGGFLERHIGDVQLLLTKPRASLLGEPLNAPGK